MNGRTDFEGRDHCSGNTGTVLLSVSREVPLSRSGASLDSRLPAAAEKVGPAVVSTTPRIASLDAIRAVASLTIAWNHCFMGNKNLQFENPGLASAVAFPSAYMGRFVLLFFVISGCVHLFLLKGRSEPRIQKMFLYRNLARIWIPAVASLFLSTIIYVLCFGVKGYGYLPSGRELVSNLLFVAHFTGDNWTNVVLWNISVQLQHVLWISLIIIPLLRFRDGPAFASTAMLLISITLTLVFPENRQDFVYYYPFFFLGYVLYEFIMSDKQTLLLGAAAALIWISYEWGYMAGVVSVVPFGLLLLNDSQIFRNPVVRWLGGISFSLYLVHAPIGTRVINLGAHWASNDWQAVLVYAIAFAAMFAAATAFHRWIEVPCTHLARRVFR